MTPESIRQAAQAAGRDGRLDWLQEQRAGALARLEADGLPTRAREEWRYTDILPALSASRASARAAAAVATRPTAATPSLFEPGQATVIVVKNGAVVAGSDPTLEPGLQLRTFASATPTERASIAASMATVSRLTGSALADINAALLDDGLLLDIAPGQALTKPVEIVYGEAVSAQVRILIRAGAGASATIVSHHRNDVGGLSNTVIDLEAGADSRLSLLRLQADSAAATSLCCLRLVLDARSEVRLQQLDLGAELARSDLVAALNGAEAQLHVHSLLLADGNRHVDQYSRVAHIGKRSVSRQLVRIIADGDSRAVFNGRVVVDKTAAGADARLTNQNLLLSARAEIDARPELEIETDDVRCSHGSTTGQLDANALFYLCSRGIGREDARQMLLGAFARQIVDQSPALVPKAALAALLVGLRPEWANWSSSS